MISKTYIKFNTHRFSQIKISDVKVSYVVDLDQTAKFKTTHFSYNSRE